MSHRWLDDLRKCPLDGENEGTYWTMVEFGCGLRLLAAEDSGDLYADFIVKGQEYRLLIARGDEELTVGDIKKLITIALVHIWETKHAAKITRKSPRTRRRLRPKPGPKGTPRLSILQRTRRPTDVVSV